MTDLLKKMTPEELKDVQSAMKAWELLGLGSEEIDALVKIAKDKDALYKQIADLTDRVNELSKENAELVKSLNMIESANASARNGNARGHGLTQELNRNA